MEGWNDKLRHKRRHNVILVNRHLPCMFSGAGDLWKSYFELRKVGIKHFQFRWIKDKKDKWQIIDLHINRTFSSIIRTWLKDERSQNKSLLSSVVVICLIFHLNFWLITRHEFFGIFCCGGYTCGQTWSFWCNAVPLPATSHHATLQLQHLSHICRIFIHFQWNINVAIEASDKGPCVRVSLQGRANQLMSVLSAPCAVYQPTACPVSESRWQVPIIWVPTRTHTVPCLECSPEEGYNGISPN